MIEEKKPNQVFQLNDETAEFEELILEEGVQLYEMLNSKLILYLVSPKMYRSFIWVGSESSTRINTYLIRKKASAIRDRIGRAIKLISVDQNDESLLFKIVVGLEKDENFVDRPYKCEY